MVAPPADPSTNFALKLPAAVPHGGTLRVVAPSGVVNPARVQSGVALLKELGFEVQCDASLLLRVCAERPYLAGSDLLRAGELQRAFADPSVDGVVCARGGYGAMRLFPHLNAALLREFSRKKQL